MGRIMSAGSILGHWHDDVFWGRIFLVPSYMHMRFCPFFDFEVDFVRLAGATRVGILYPSSFFAPHKNSNIPKSVPSYPQWRYIDGTFWQKLTKKIVRAFFSQFVFYIEGKGCIIKLSRLKFLKTQCKYLKIEAQCALFEF